MKLELAATATQDLTRIGDYIAQDSPARALAFVQMLRAKLTLLPTMPQAFPLVPRYEAHGIRRYPVADYLIFYRAEEARVVVIHILHGAQDYEALLFP